MCGRAISLVRSQLIGGKYGVPCRDHAVALDFGNDRSGRNRGGKRIAVDDGLLLASERGQLQGIDEEAIRHRTKCLHCLGHGKPCRMIDVELIDAGDIDGCYGPGYTVLLDALGENLAGFCRKQFRVAQSLDAVFRIEYDCASDDWAEESAASNFVDTCDQLRASGPEFALEPGGALQPLQQAQLQRRLR